MRFEYSPLSFLLEAGSTFFGLHLGRAYFELEFWNASNPGLLVGQPRLFRLDVTAIDSPMVDDKRAEGVRFLFTEDGDWRELYFPGWRVAFRGPENLSERRANKLQLRELREEAISEKAKARRQAFKIV